MRDVLQQPQSLIQAPPQVDLVNMMQQILSGHHALINKIANMEDEILQLKTQRLREENELADPKAKAIEEEAKKPRIDVQCFYLQEKDEKVELIKDDNEETLLGLDKLFNESQDEMMDNGMGKEDKKSEIAASKVEFMEAYTMELVSPPKAKTKKKKTNEAKALGYGNDGTKGKKKQLIGHDPTPLASLPSSMILIPWKYENGAIEYKVKCKGRAKPFAKARATLSTELKEKGQSGIQEVMAKELLVEFKDPPWSVHTPHSFT